MNSQAGRIDLTLVHWLPDTDDIYAEQARIVIKHGSSGGSNHIGGNMGRVNAQRKGQGDRDHERPSHAQWPVGVISMCEGNFCSIDSAIVISNIDPDEPSLLVRIKCPVRSCPSYTGCLRSNGLVVIPG